MVLPPAMHRIFKGFVLKNKGLIALTVGSAVFTFVTESVVIPRILSSTFTTINTPGELKKNLFKLVASWVVTQSGSALNDWCLGRIDPALSLYMNHLILDQLFLAYENEHNHLNTTEIMEKITVIQETIQRILYRIIFSLLPRFITILAILVNIYSINRRLGIYTSALLFLFITIAISWNQKNTNVLHTSLNARLDYTTKVSDVFSNMELVNSTPSALDKEKHACLDLNIQHEEQDKNAQQTVRMTQMIMYACNVVIFVVVLYILYGLYIKNELTNEKVTTVLLSISPLFNNMSEIMYYIPELVKLLSVLNFHEPFVNHLMKQEVSSGIDTTFSSNEIVFDALHFSYGESKLFDNMSLTIPANSFVTLRGPSGSGKTSLLKLLFRIHTPQSGTIRVGGYDLYQLSTACVKQNIMYLHQHSTLLNDTVYHNMMYGLEPTDAVRANVIALLKKYKLHSLFTDTDSFDFLDEKVGILGEKLSGGQRQVVHLIRCMIHDHASIIILDEPTSAVDTHHKALIMTMIKDLHAQGKTILLISHDESVSSTWILDFSTMPQPLLKSHF
jgi:ABC-type multidrug transport system fused ATPase/permease subunit